MSKLALCGSTPEISTGHLPVATYNWLSSIDSGEVEAPIKVAGYEFGWFICVADARVGDETEPLMAIAAWLNTVCPENGGWVQFDSYGEIVDALPLYG